MNCKLLVVDDDASVRKIIGRALRSSGLEVLEAADGDEALAIVEREKPALVVMDIHMPNLDGIATLDTILELNPATAVIIVTGDATSKRAQLAVERGACGFIAKPFDFSYLCRSVQENLLSRGYA